VLISIPRDSYVDIPGHGWNKINAALAYGGRAC
jgi:anionic cell wall polymer biosynthesis LytR-Cps2A-Psr (LCP) family protein